MTQDPRTHEIAYQIWEAEGKPACQHERHWRMACKLVATDCSPQTPAPTPVARPKPSVAKAVAPATGMQMVTTAGKQHRIPDMAANNDPAG